MDQNLSLYEVFYTVAKAGNISLAAKEMYISQPAVSKSIKKLEENLETTLFLRNSRGVTLTDEGKELYRHIKIAFDSISTGEETLKNIHELGIGHVKIGVSSTLCKYILLPFLKEFVEQYPHIQITIRCQSTIHTLQLLEQNEIDIGLIGKPEENKNLVCYPLGEIEDVFVSTKSYLKNLILREKNETSDVFPSHKNVDYFKLGTVLLLDKENLTRRYIDHYLSLNMIEVNHILEVTDMDLLVEFSKIGLGIGCVIKEFVKEDLDKGNLVEIPLLKPIKKREICFAHLEKYALSSSAKTFLGFCLGGE